MIQTATMVMILVEPRDGSALQPNPDIGLFDRVAIPRADADDVRWYALVYADDNIGIPLTPPYARGFLQRGGVENIQQRGDYRLGGGAIQNNPTTINLRNTDNLIDKLREIGIETVGKRVYVIEHEWEVTGYNNQVINPKRDVLFVGRINTCTYNEVNLTLNAVSDFELERRANIMIDGLPITFGNHNTGFNKNVGESVFIEADAFLEEPLGDGNINFPVVESRITAIDADSSQQIQVLRLKLGGDRHPTWGESSLDRYLFRTWDATSQAPPPRSNFFCAGAGETFGVPILRFAVEWSVYNQTDRPSDYPVYTSFDAEDDEIICVLERPIPSSSMPTEMVFVRPEIAFASDGWPNTVSPDPYHPEIPLPLPDDLKPLYYVADDGRILPASTHGGVYDYHERLRLPVKGGRHVLKRAVILNEAIGTDGGEIYTYRTAVGSNLRLVTADTLSQYGTSNWPLSTFKLANQSVPGVYVSANPPHTSAVPSGGWLQDAATATDGNLDTCAEYKATCVINGQSTVALAMTFTVPLPPDDINVNSAYVMLKIEVAARTIVGILHGLPTKGLICVRESLRSSDVTAQSTMEIISGSSSGTTSSGAAINDIMGEPLEWPLAGRRNGGKFGEYDAFLHEDIRDFETTIAESGRYIRDLNRSLTGYRTFRIDNLDFSNGRSKECTLIFFSPGNTANYTGIEHEFHIKLYHLGVIYEDVVDVSEGILAPTTGRMFDGNLGLNYDESIWGTPRRDENAVIDNPVDVLEHTRRLSDLREYTAVDGGKWGKSYPYGDLIDIGAFDSPALDELRQLKIANQITDEGSANTDDIAKSICEDFYMVTKLKRPYIERGYAWGIGDYWHVEPPRETVLNIKTPSIPDEDIPVITLSEIDGSVNLITVKEPSSNDIYCEPVIHYNYNHLSEKYENTLAVTNIASADVWEESFTPGFEPNHGEAIWNQCRAIFSQYKNFSEMPQALQEQEWINTYETALWKIRKVIEWPLYPRTSITVSWNTGKLWEVGTHIKLSLPHIKFGALLPCVCEGVTKSKKNGTVKCDLIILESVLKPRVLLFGLSNSIPVYSDELLTLVWETIYATRVELRDVDEDIVLYEGDDVNGSFDYELTPSPEMYQKTFLLTAYNDHGESDSRTLVVDALGVFEIIGSIFTSPESPFARTGSADVTVRWVVQAQQDDLTVERVTLNGDDVDIQGEQTITISEDTEWVIRAYVSDGIGTRRGTMTRLTVIDRGTGEVASPVSVVLPMSGYVRPIMVDGGVIPSRPSELINAVTIKPLTGSLRPTAAESGLIAPSRPSEVISAVTVKVPMSGYLRPEGVIGDVVADEKRIAVVLDNPIALGGYVGVGNFTKTDLGLDPVYPQANIKLPLSGYISVLEP